MKNDRILFISQEIAPYLPETALSLTGRRMPQQAQEGGYEVRTFMPRYTCINERRNQLHEVIRLSGMNIIIDDSDHPLIIKVATLQPTRMQVYFIDNDDYFQPQPDKALETRTLLEDNDERSMFFVRGVIETVRKLRWEPKIVQCAGWISALSGLFIKHIYSDDPIIGNSKVVYALSSEAFPGTLDPRMQDKLLAIGFTPEQIADLGDQPVDWMTLNRAAINAADAIVVADNDVPSELIEYAKATGKPMLDYTALAAEDESQAINELYAALLDQTNE